MSDIALHDHGTMPAAVSTRTLFVLTILTGSFLLFLIQPMIARMALPRLGGAPSVWNSAMLVYQALLLGGYYYAHRLSFLAPRTQAIVHIGLFAVAALWLPIGLASGELPSGVSPVLWVPWLLFASIGPVFLAVSAQAPLMQRWYSLASDGAEPYALYAASNFGSFAGLMAYPLVVEPSLPLSQQSLLWSVLYGVLFGFIVLSGWTVRRIAGDPARGVADTPLAATAQDRSSPADAPRWRTRLAWIALAAVPSGLMLSTTTHLTTDIIAMPLLWVIPLGLYLLSFTVAFADRQGLAEAIRRLSPIAVLALGWVAVFSGQGESLAMALVNLLLLFIIAVALHNEMYRRRPSPRHLTLFYLMMSVGGVIGGIFCAIVAPLLFDWVYEHPLLVIAGAALVPQWRLGLWRSVVRGPASNIARAQTGVGVTILLLFLVNLFVVSSGEASQVVLIALFVCGLAAMGRRPVYVMALVAMLLVAGGFATLRQSLGDIRTRSYFGIYTVQDNPAIHARTLSHGTTVHGRQSTVPGREKVPTSYYGAQSGVGRALTMAPRLYGPAARISVVGLGAGTLACYRLPGQDWRFYEIDPAMVAIARDRSKFSFLARCAPYAPIEIGDARLRLAEGRTPPRDILVIDAFSSDAIPMHLLTREAFAVYRRNLTADGLLLVHISNRFIDLAPVIAAQARAMQWQSMGLNDRTKRGDDTGLAPSYWIALSPDRTVIDALAAEAPGWQPLTSERRIDPWTDSFATVLPLIKSFR